MKTAVTSFASSTAPEGDMLGSLGIDVQLLILQTVAFLLLLFILTKYVFPKLNAMLDKRDKAIADSLKAASEAEKNAAKSQGEVEKLLKTARRDADEIVASAKAEAGALVDAAEKKSRERAEQIVADAEAELKSEVERARQALKKETLELVTAATEKVVGGVVSEKVDEELIRSAVDGAKNT
ncbi:MAG TPA: F0F1 ATP synthase subunit B [Candidatus Saccharibacteria bacterium]|nr:F0F1 ATP synthase subunit B [Candidatus Saccharibacteria bacterium]